MDEFISFRKWLFYMTLLSTLLFASKDTDYPNTIPHDGTDGCRAGQISFGQWTADKFSGVHGSVSSHGRSL